MCEFCENGRTIVKNNCVGFLEVSVNKKQLQIGSFCNDRNYDNFEEIPIRYCPFCGERLEG